MELLGTHLSELINEVRDNCAKIMTHFVVLQSVKCRMPAMTIISRGPDISGVFTKKFDYLTKASFITKKGR